MEGQGGINQGAPGQGALWGVQAVGSNCNNCSWFGLDNASNAGGEWGGDPPAAIGEYCFVIYDRVSEWWMDGGLPLLLRIKQVVDIAWMGNIDGPLHPLQCRWDWGER